MHLVINQDVNSTERVDGSVITKLYNLARGGVLDNTSVLRGTLLADVASRKQVDYLENMFDNLHITATTYSISFDDPEAESTCISFFGSDGSVTENQLRAVTSVAYKWRNNTNLTTFDEFQYFTGINANNSNVTQYAFSGCSNLEQITLPNNITCLGSSMFSWCTSLQSITIPNSVLSVENAAFTRCTALTSLTFTGLSGNCYIGEYLNELTSLTCNEGTTYINVTNAPKLTSLTIPSSVTGLNVYNCGITTLTIPSTSSVDVSGYAALSMSSLTTINNPENLIKFGQYTFYNCSRLTTSITIPTANTEVPNSCFNGCSAMPQVTVPSHVTSIGAQAFSGFNSNGKIIFQGTTPPTMSNSNSFSLAWGSSVGCKIYVPDSALNDYKSATNWSTYADRIYPVSDLT